MRRLASHTATPGNTLVLAALWLAGELRFWPALAGATVAAAAWWAARPLVRRLLGHDLSDSAPGRHNT